MVNWNIGGGCHTARQVQEAVPRAMDDVIIKEIALYSHITHKK
jgi:hypothetical protein